MRSRTAALDGSSKQIRCASPAAESVRVASGGEETTWAPGNQWDRLEFTYVDTGAVAPHQIVDRQHHIIGADVVFEHQRDGHVDAAFDKPLVDCGRLVDTDAKVDLGPMSAKPGCDRVEQRGQARPLGRANAYQAGGLDRQEPRTAAS